MHFRYFTGIRFDYGRMYEKIVLWSDEDECFVGTCPDLFDGGVHGDNVDSVSGELDQVMYEWLLIGKKSVARIPDASE